LLCPLPKKLLVLALRAYCIFSDIRSFFFLLKRCFVYLYSLHPFCLSRGAVLFPF
jgi:hypothetical protein